jgi:hypothetical protein
VASRKTALLILLWAAIGPRLLPAPARAETPATPATVKQTINAAPPTRVADLTSLPALDFLRFSPFSAALVKWDRTCATVIHFERGQTAYVECSGTIRHGFTLAFNSQDLPLTKDRFTFRIELPESPRLYVMQLRAPDGRSLLQEFRYSWVQPPPRPFSVKISDGQALTDSTVEFVGNFPSTAWIRLRWINVGELRTAEIDTGIAYLSYHESTRNPVSIIGLLIAASYQYEVFDTWSVFGRGRLLALPLSTSGDTESTRLLELELGVRKRLSEGSRFGQTIEASYEYDTLLTPNHAYGFANVGGPRVGWIGNYALTIRRALQLEIAVGLLNNDSSLIALDCHTVEGRVLYIWRPVNSLVRWGGGLGVKNVTLNFSNGTSSATLPYAIGFVSF